MASRFEHDMDETETANVVEKSETAFENEDESDQAKASLFSLYYLEFNYHFAHLVIVYLPCSIIWKAMKSTI